MMVTAASWIGATSPASPRCRHTCAARYRFAPLLAVRGIAGVDEQAEKFARTAVPNAVALMVSDLGTSSMCAVGVLDAALYNLAVETARPTGRAVAVAAVSSRRCYGTKMPWRRSFGCDASGRLPARGGGASRLRWGLRRGDDTADRMLPHPWGAAVLLLFGCRIGHRHGGRDFPSASCSAPGTGDNRLPTGETRGGVAERAQWEGMP